LENSELDNIKSIVADAMRDRHPAKTFVPGQTPVPVTGKVFGEPELLAAVQASLDFWLTSGPYTDIFERSLASRVGVRHAFMVNSGSSANLVALSALTSPSLGDRALKKGDEVITVAAGFPTTVTPILQNGLTPVYIDVDLETYVANDEAFSNAVTGKTKAIMMAHTLGNPFNLELAQELSKKHGLWLIEDSCDALGGTYKDQNLGTFGDMSTLSFYPAHHITTGEGGAILTKKPSLKPLIESFRDWGRDCWCAPGCDNTCLKRFEWKLGELPEGFDHKYTYSHLGYNLKSGDIQAAIGSAQLERLDSFVAARRSNWSYLYEGLKHLEEYLILPRPVPDGNPSWFGFALTVRQDSPINRNQLVQELDKRKIAARLLFGGNLLKQPAFANTPRKIIGDLRNTDVVMESTFWIGVWPGLSHEMLDFVIESFNEIFKRIVK
jgi:CDP-6-deoxy-D-xylo-4-hexulose-3-dehydrase